MSGRAIDVIDVNRIWSVFVGSRRWGHGLATVQAASRVLAMNAARAKCPGTRIGFVEELRA